MWVDEEGLLKRLDYGFAWSGLPQPYAGNGIVLSGDGDRSTDATVSAAWVRERANFWNT